MALAVGLAAAMGSTGARADEPVAQTPDATTAAQGPQAPPALPAGTPIGLHEAVRLARSRGFDVLVAAAQVRGAEADVRAAGAVPNPLFNAELGRTMACPGTCSTGSPWGWGVGVADQGLIEGALSRKRALREAVAQHAVDAAKFGRTDVERILVAQTKIQYVQTAAALARLDFSRDVAATLNKAVEVNRVRYPRVIDEGQLARVEQEALKADQEVERAIREYRQQQIELAYLFGVTGPIPEIAVDKGVLTFRVPEALASIDKQALLKLALEARPDRRQAAAREALGDAQIAFAKRQRFPDVSLSVNYQQQGTGDYSTQLPTLIFGAALPIPLLYQQQGEIRRAEADRDAASLSLRKLDSAVASDIESAFNAFVTARAIVQRYESALLDRAKRAREITQVQYNAGSATLTDLLDAQRSFVQVNSDYYDELVNYWTAVFSLEQAVGKELVP
jgi:cobalt-zinc-cadmium efflux system outer membrane protein